MLLGKIVITDEPIFTYILVQFKIQVTMTFCYHYCGFRSMVHLLTVSIKIIVTVKLDIIVILSREIKNKLNASYRISPSVQTLIFLDG